MPSFLFSHASHRTHPWRALLPTALIAALALSGCATSREARDLAAYQRIKSELDQAAAARPPAAPAMEPITEPRPVQVAPSVPRNEPRFSLAVNDAPADTVFLSIVSDTRYSMLVHPEVVGRISINLQNVTVFEALDSIRELYGYDYRVEGTRILIQPLSAQTRVFKINYIAGQRKGISDIRVTSGSVTDMPTTTSSDGYLGSTTQAVAGPSFETSRVSTSTLTDFWSELSRTLGALVGDKDGNRVVLNPQSGVVLVRARSAEMRQVENYLKAIQGSVNRQVMLEAKIIEVQLNDDYQAGINWAAFNRAGQTRFAVGATPTGIGFPSGNSVLGSTLGSVLGQGAASPLTIAALTDNFAGLINFLDTQGTVHVLSSPRIATLNNQQAVLKVGTDEFFVTNVSSTTTALGVSGAVSSPNVTLRPFFSGIALDVTPQISEGGQITLHIHPAITRVLEKIKVVDLGNGQGELRLPLASSSVSETDSIVRVRDGTTVAIGGLMRQAFIDDDSSVPGAAQVPVLGAFFRQRNRSSQKRELVILLKTTVVDSGEDWSDDILRTRERIQAMDVPTP
jgi:MSHA biogenesis protein MshL